ncbi:MAG: hypothetical protein A2029_07545 [Chloroflexi bacterium RBG_19FT_COMBO_47_9]|nr:MAG: hypothetical protein A2029_07545 [Chloroflexi bacterium RBG_19FT_COMBO_47_9]
MIVERLICDIKTHQFAPSMPDSFDEAHYQTNLFKPSLIGRLIPPMNLAHYMVQMVDIRMNIPLHKQEITTHELDNKKDPETCITALGIRLFPLDFMWV